VKGSSSIKPVSQTAVKMPKAKKLADPFGKKSLLVKAEYFGHVKHPSVIKLRDFLLKKHKANKIN